MRSAVTVVITNYNHADYLKCAVSSVLAQTRLPDRVIVIDDGSTDSSEQVLAELPRSVEVVRQPNQGIVATRNRALLMVDTSHVLYVDADDFLLPEYLRGTEFFWSCFRRRSLALVYTPARLLYSDGSRGYLPSRPWDTTALGGRNFVTNTALMSVAALSAVGGYSHEFAEIGHEDWDLMLKLAEQGWCGRLLPVPLFTYRILPTGRNARSALHSNRVNAAIQRAHPWTQPGEASPVRPHSPSALMYKLAWRWDRTRP